MRFIFENLEYALYLYFITSIHIFNSYHNLNYRSICVVNGWEIIKCVNKRT